MTELSKLFLYSLPKKELKRLAGIVVEVKELIRDNKSPRR